MKFSSRISCFIATGLLSAILLAACSTSKSIPLTEPSAVITVTKITSPSTSTPSPTKVTSGETYIPSAEVDRTLKIQTLTPSPSVTQIPSATPVITSTSQPALVSHTWEVEQILVQVELTNGDGWFWYTDPPVLVLYADGLFIRSNCKGCFGHEMMARKLERREMCALLNTLDQVGFLDYDPSVYRDPMDGLPNTFITVNAWKKQQIYGQVLAAWVYEGGDWWLKECEQDECLPPPVILPALSKAYKLLDHYDPGGLEYIPPSQMVVWAVPEEEDIPASPWPIKEITLKEITQKVDEEDYMLVVDDPVIVRSLEKNVSSGLYFEGEETRMVSLRPLWPAETHFGMWFPGLPTAAPWFRLVPK